MPDFPPPIHPLEKVEPVSYIIFKRDNLIYAKNGRTGEIEFQDEDAATVIQQAINALPDGGGKIFIKSGEYNLSTTVTISKTRVDIIGEGKSTVLKINGDYAGIKFYFESTTISMCSVREIKIEGPGTSYVNAHGIVVEKADRIKIINVRITGCRIGILFRRCRGADLILCGIKHCYYGVFAEETEAHAHAISAYRCWCDTIEQDGWNLKCCDGVFLFSCTASGCGRYGFFFGDENTPGNQSCCVTVVGCTADLCGADGFRIEGVDESNKAFSFNLLGAWASECRIGIVMVHVRNSVISSPVLSGLDENGIRLDDVNILNITGGRIASYKETHGAIYATSSNDIHISSVQITAGATSAVHAITLESCDDCYVHGCNLDKDIYTSGTNNKVKHNFPGHITENSGTATFSGDGSTTQFTIPHGLAAEPTSVNVTPLSPDAARSFYVTKDETNIYVNYLTPPPEGTDNVVLSWKVEV